MLGLEGLWNLFFVKLMVLKRIEMKSLILYYVLNKLLMFFFLNRYCGYLFVLRVVFCNWYFGIDK